jgi:hypothetical protein
VRALVLRLVALSLLFVSSEAAGARPPPPVWVRHRLRDLPGIANDPIAGWAGVGTCITTVTTDEARVVANAVDFGAYVFVAGPVYFGPTFQVGWLSSAMPRGATQVSDQGTFTQIAGALGLETFASGALSLRFEAVTGWHRVVMMGAFDTKQSQSGSFLIQPRIALDAWGSSRFVFSVWVGTDALHPTDFAGGLALALHFTDFDAPPPDPKSSEVACVTCVGRSLH